MTRRWRAWALDALLLTGAIACFALFASRQSNPPGFASNGPVAKFVGGHASRKPHGVPAYSAVAVGAEFHNLDTLWVDAGDQATIEWMSGEKIEFGERTLTLLKRPFSSSTALKAQIIVFRGQAKVVGTNLQFLPVKAIKDALPPRPTASPVPSPSPSPSPEPRVIFLERILPQPGSVVYVPPGKSADVTFFWSRKLDGFLMVRDPSEKEADFFPVQNEQSLKIPRKLQRTYEWQLVDTHRQRLMGPFRFELRAGGLGGMEKLIQQSISRPTEVRLHPQ